MCKCCAESVECIFLFVKIGVKYPQAIISMTLMKFTVLYTATLEGGKQLLRKNLKSNLLISQKSSSAHKADRQNNIG